MAAASSSSASGAAAPETRLMITKLRMENFKSYRGVQEVGPFHNVSRGGEEVVGEGARGRETDGDEAERRDGDRDGESSFKTTSS